MKWYLCLIKDGIIDVLSDPLGVYTNIADGIKDALEYGKNNPCILVSEMDFINLYPKINSPSNGNSLS